MLVFFYFYLYWSFCRFLIVCLSLISVYLINSFFIFFFLCVFLCKILTVVQIQTFSSFVFVSFCVLSNNTGITHVWKKKFSIISVAQETFNKFLIRFFHFLSLSLSSSPLPFIPPSSLSSFVLFCFCLLLLLLLSSSCFPSSHFVIPYRVVLFHHEMFFYINFIFKIRR